MSYRAMMKHRCQILLMAETAENGVPVIGWSPVLDTLGQPAIFPCFLDLNFIRKGKDPQWTPEAGRPADRSGVFFALGDIPLKSGDRIQMVAGPAGTFLAEGAFDEAWTPRARHHIEIGVVEVAGQIARAQYVQPPSGGR
jgi:hypothetical protein